MHQHWPVNDLDVDRLLAYWRWLCPQELTLVDRNAFGDLFLRKQDGAVFRLDVGAGTFSKIAASEVQFFELAGIADMREEWFAESDSEAAAKRGLIPGPVQCIGFSIPIVFAEAGFHGDAYVADIYDYLGFLGDIHRQISTMPDGTQVKLRLQP